MGVEWVVLTNGIQWKIFKVIFGKPIDQELILDFDIPVPSIRRKMKMLNPFTYWRKKGGPNLPSKITTRKGRR